MWRIVAGGAAALLLVTAGIFFFNTRAATDRSLPGAPKSLAQIADAAAPLPDDVPEATARTREERRFGRYDKDRNGAITQEEFLANRRKAYARLDANHDGTLSFDEWAAKAEAKFASADADKNGAMNPTEFQATAVKRSARARVKCPPDGKAGAAPAEEDG